MENKKIKILHLPSDGAGVGHARSIWPAQEMQKCFDNDFEVEIDTDFVNDIDHYKKFDIIHFHRQFGPYDNLSSRIDELRANGTVTIMDLDDYWIPSKTHPMYLAAINDKMPEKILSAFKCVDYVQQQRIFLQVILKSIMRMFMLFQMRLICRNQCGKMLIQERQIR